MTPTSTSNPPREALPLVYQTVKRQLLGQLGKSRPVGAKLPSIPQLARDMNAGQTSTHRAVKELMREGFLVGRPGRGTYVHRTPHQTGSAADPAEHEIPATKSTTALVTADPLQLFHKIMSDAFISRANEIGLDVDQVGLARKRFKHINRLPYTTIVLVNPPNRWTINCRADQSVVLISTAPGVQVEGSRASDTVMIDDVAGAALAGRRLRDAGCRSACFIGVTRSDNDRKLDISSRQRLAGFERGFGASVPASAQLLGAAYALDLGAELAQKYIAMDPRPEAVFAAADELAMGFLCGALAAGLVAGRDFQLIGFDGQPLGQSLMTEPLTTIQAPLSAMGRQAFALLQERLIDPDLPSRQVILHCALSEGSTVRPAG